MSNRTTPGYGQYRQTTSCTSFLFPAARVIQSFGLDGANGAQGVGKGSEFFWVCFLRL